MSKRANKRAKKLDQDVLFGVSDALISLNNNTSAMRDDELFTMETPESQKQLSAKQLRKKELVALLFNPTVKTEFDVLKRKQLPKTTMVGKLTSTSRLKSNRRLKNLLERDEVAAAEQLQELAELGVVFSKTGVSVKGYAGDDHDGDINNDEIDFLFMRNQNASDQMKWSSAAAILASDKDNYDDTKSDGEDGKEQTNKPITHKTQTLTTSKKSPADPKSTKQQQPKQLDEDNEEGDEVGQESEPDSDPEFMADWIKYTGNVTKPIKSLKKQNKIRLAQLKALEERQLARIEKESTLEAKIHVTPAALAKSYITRKHVDFIDTSTLSETQDMWDDDVIQKQAETKLVSHSSNAGRQDSFDMENNKDYMIAMVGGAMKNTRHAKTSKHVTTQSLRVAPSGLSINPVKEDMDALVAVWDRKATNDQRKIENTARRMDADRIKVKYVPNVSAKDRDAYASSIYKAIPDGHDVHKQKTRTERNAEKKKAENRYKHMLEKRERAFAAQVKGIYAEVQKMKKHEKFLEEKLPQIRAEAAEIKKDQPIKFGRNYYKALKPDLQTESTLAQSGGNLRRTTMSLSLLADAFNSLQRTNQLPAVGKSGKRFKKAKYNMKDAMAAGVRVEKIDVNEVMKKAKERAAANPKPVAATKNKKRKFQEFEGAHGKNVVQYDGYGYDSDDDIWG